MWFWDIVLNHRGIIMYMVIMHMVIMFFVIILKLASCVLVATGGELPGGLDRHPVYYQGVDMSA